MFGDSIPIHEQFYLRCICTQSNLFVNKLIFFAFYFIISFISDILNYFVFFIICFVIDIWMVIKLRSTLKEKLEKFASMIKNDKQLEVKKKETENI